MGSFKLGGMTLSGLFKKPETTLYPFETKPVPEGLKGQIELEPETCILCGICSKTCPCDAIVIDKKDRTWLLDPFLCIQCGSCVRACPKGCLVMNPAYTAPAAGRSTRTVFVPDPKAKAEKAENAE